MPIGPVPIGPVLIGPADRSDRSAPDPLAAPTRPLIERALLTRPPPQVTLETRSRRVSRLAVDSRRPSG
jgi:hypothetical protein